MTQDVLKYLQPNAAIPIDMETTSLLVNALKKALADHAMQEVQRLGQEIEQEPKIGCVNHDCDQCKAQTERKPLTDEEIEPMATDLLGYGALIKEDMELFTKVVRAVEAAHGIKENT